MSTINNIVPKISLEYLLGLLVKPFVPLPLLQLGVNALTNRFQEMHPGVLQRMGAFPHAKMILDPIDLPYYFFVEFLPDNLNIIILADDTYVGSEFTRIAASLEFFLHMLQRDSDGDALFFSRQLTIEGDTTVVVALRNILEAESINLDQDIQNTFGQFAPIVFFIQNVLLNHLHNLNTNLHNMQQSLTGQIQAELNFHKHKQVELKQQLHELTKQVQILNNKINSLRKKDKQH